MDKRASGITGRILKTVGQTVDRYGMIESGDRVLAGVSGGPDSVALVHILKQIASALPFDLALAHLNHGLRGEASDRDEGFTASLAQQLGLPFHREKADVKGYGREQGLSTEHAGRRLRYDFFHRVMEEFAYSKIALGHHGDDNAEMVLMALIRGSGPLGLAGIPPVRDHGVIRPLFHLTRRQILSYLDENNLNYVVDETNLSAHFLRNKIRLELIPLLENQYNPQMVRSLNRLSDILRAENQSRKDHTEKQAESRVLKGTGHSRRILASFLNQLPSAEKRNLVREMIRKTKGDLKRITLAHVEGVLSLAVSKKGDGRLDLPDKILVRKTNQQLFFSKEDLPLRAVKILDRESGLPAYQYAVNGPQDLYIKEINARVSFCETEGQSAAEFCSAGQEIAFFDINQLKFPLILRNSRPEDRFIPLGMTDSQTVRKFLKNHGVAEKMRHNYPVLVCHGAIIWVVGKRIDESVKVSEQTRMVLKAHFQWTS
ncbi:MAG: tRNA lysidine(34) synthetase TilS [Proteobacteria bacterium]|nr:tRNA lysidine(34) synthetase TilS [Pseudomonadota bacterium]MBU4471181.1 tRNA lysidine(34) synthetase TilS [Pseudomonadota bacterium]MCG2753156.1 tRNA lysidine(34) synthetase TilS [Desulfobacteraceae bacterium]